MKATDSPTIGDRSNPHASTRFPILQTAVLCCLALMSAHSASAQTAGTLKWEFLTPGAQIFSSPAIADDGTVYIGTRAPWPGLYAVNPNGTEKWVHLPRTDIWATPAVAQDGTIYFGAEDEGLFFAVNPDGTEKWELEVNGDVYSSAAIGRDGTIYFGTRNRTEDNIYAVNPNGSVKWSLDTGLDIESSPAVSPNGTVYFSGEGLVILAVNPNGSEKWTLDLPGGTGAYGIVSSPAVGIDGAIYIGGGNGNLYALNPDGTIRWSYDTGAKIVSSPTIDSSGTIYVGSWNGVLSAVNPDGSLKWDLALGNQIDSAPAIGADGTIYVARWGGRLNAVSADGTALWDFGIGGEPISSPAIGADGTIYVGGYRYLYAIHSDSPGLAQSVWPMYRQNVKRTGRSETLLIPLTLGQPFQIGLQPGQAHNFSLETSGGESLLVEVTADSGISELALYGQHKGMAYQTTSPTPRGTWELVITPTVGGEYLLTVIGTDVDVAGGQYTILADYVTRHLSDVEPHRAGNAGATRLRISGLGFESGMVVELRAPGLPTLVADEVTVSSSSELLARFDLIGADTGLYDLHLTWPSATSDTLVDVFEITTGTGGVLEAHLEAPEALRPDRRYTLWLIYANTGDADLPAPLFSVRSPNALLSLNPDRIESNRLEILGVGSTADPDVLAVGESRRVPIYFIAPNAGSVDFTLAHTIGGSGPVDWESQKDSIKPPGMDSATWDALWPDLKTRLGVTWDDYLGVLRSDARLLGSQGGPPHDVAEMIRLEMFQVAGISVTAVSGILRHADTFEPLTGVTLRLRNADGTVLRQTETAYSPPGRFQFANVADETYDVYVDGYTFEPPETVNVAGTDITDLELFAQELFLSEDSDQLDIPQHTPTVTVDESGTQYLVWQQGSEIWWAKDSGSGWNAGGPIPNAVGARPVIAYDPELLDGGLTPGLFVAWETLESPQIIEWLVGDLSDTDIAWTAPQALTGDNFDDTGLAVLVDDLHDPVVLWLQRDFSLTDDTDLYYLPLDLGAALSTRSQVEDATSSADPAEQICSFIETRMSQLLDPFIPIIGGQYGFSVWGELCGDLECTLSRSLTEPLAEVRVPHGHENYFSLGLAPTLNAMWETEACSCQYVFDTASLEMSVPIDFEWTSSGVPLYFRDVIEIAPLSALIGTAYLKSFGTGELDGSLSWHSNFPGLWDFGDVSFWLEEQITGLLHSDEGIAFASISGSAWVYWQYTFPPYHFEYSDVCLQLQGEAFEGFGSMRQVFSQSWGDCLTEPSLEASADGVQALPVIKDLSYIKSPLVGTGASYEGNTVLADLSTDLYNDGLPAASKSAAGEMMVVWSKDEASDALGSQIFAATFSGIGWNTPFALTTEIDFNKDPAMVFDSYGYPMAIWSSASNSGLNYDTATVEELLAAMQNADLVYSRRIGSSWSTPATLASLSGRDEQTALGVGPHSGVLTAAWLNQSATGWKLYASIWNGGQWLTPTVVAEPTLASRPTVIYSGSTPMVFWAQDGDDDPETLDDWILYTSSRSGSAWSAPEPVDLAVIVPSPSASTIELTSGEESPSIASPASLTDPPDGCCEDCVEMDPLPPDPPPVVQEPVDETVSEVVAGIDPNEKVGTQGQGAEHYVLAGDRLSYKVYFENLPTASAPAQEVFVTDCLPPELDWSTLRLNEIAFGEAIVANSGTGFLFQDRVTIPDYRPAENTSWWVEIEPEFDFVTGCLDITLRTLDPETGELPTDPFAGFLPPENGSGRGQGHVGFSIDAKSGLADGTLIANRASIVFDTNAPIVTNTWSNTIGQPAGFFSLAVSRTGSGSGTVTSHPPGIDCGSDCNEVYASGTTVTLNASPDPGSILVGWTGDPDCTDGAVVMNASKSCVADFRLFVFNDGFESGDTSSWTNIVQ